MTEETKLIRVSKELHSKLFRLKLDKDYKSMDELFKNEFDTI